MNTTYKRMSTYYETKEQFKAFNTYNGKVSYMTSQCVGNYRSSQVHVLCKF